MNVRPLPKSWLIHEITYEEYLGVNDWNNPHYAEPITITNVRFDDSSVFSRDSTDTKILANAVVFVDAVNSNPSVDFKEQSKIKFNDREYVIQKVVSCYFPNKNKIHHWELEVI